MPGCPVCIVELLLLIWSFSDKLNDGDDDDDDDDEFAVEEERTVPRRLRKLFFGDAKNKSTDDRFFSATVFGFYIVVV